MPFTVGTFVPGAVSLNDESSHSCLSYYEVSTSEVIPELDILEIVFSTGGECESLFFRVDPSEPEDNRLSLDFSLLDEENTQQLFEGIDSYVDEGSERPPYSPEHWSVFILKNRYRKTWLIEKNTIDFTIHFTPKGVADSTILSMETADCIVVDVVSRRRCDI